MVDATGTTTYSYDAVNRLTSVTFPGSRTVGYSYSNVGNRATMTYPGGSDQVSYGYDAANNLTSVTDWNSNQTQYAYNNAGMLTTVTLPSGTGIVGTYSYDNADRLTDIDWVKSGSTTIASVTYGLDANGNRKQRVDDYGTSNYGFDALYRLTSVDYPSGTDDTFTYDAVGNRLTRNSSNYTYDAADRLTAVGSTNYGYDDNGNLTSRGSDSFSWDAENRLTSATVNSATTTFAYNGDGLRDSLTFNSNTTTFTWDIAAGIPQVLDDEDFRYVYGLGRVSEVGPGTTTRYYLTDALGSVLALADSSGSVLNSYEYDVFGGVRSSTGSTANAFTFTGEQTDASTGLEYLRARYYDADTGRFLSLDPLGDGYDYAYDNPAMYTDPSGLRPNSACPTLKARIDGLSGDSKMVEYWRRVWSGVYAQHCGDGIMPPAADGASESAAPAPNVDCNDDDPLAGGGESVDPLESCGDISGNAGGGGDGGLISKITRAVSRFVRSVLDKGPKLSRHGAQRVQEHGFSVKELEQILKSGKVYLQADGAKVYVRPNATSAGYYDFVIVGQRGIVTAHKHMSKHGMDSLAKNYGWQGWAY
jgi:RHS repeat-associated protein